jgi:ABC-type nitrate/sulfonate/bicarbonate transport system permease component
MALANPLASEVRSRPGLATRLRPFASRVGMAGLAVVVILALWSLALVVFDVQPFVGKSPLDVWNFLFTDDLAGANRSVVAENLVQSLIDASIGFAAGLAVAFALAALFLVVRGVENALMPIALLLQSVPLIAMAPIIILIFGRTTSTLAVMGGLVVLFPALITIVFGLRSASPSMVDLVTVYGGGPLTVLRKVAIPAALPAVFAAVKISVPGAITGALIAEWLATGQGIGGAIVSAVGQAQIDLVWALGTVITVVSIALYTLVGLAEGAVLGRVGVTQTALR